VVAAAATVTILLTGSHFTGGTQLVSDRGPGGPPWVVRLAVIPQARVHDVLVGTTRAMSHAARAGRSGRTETASLASDGAGATQTAANSGGQIPPPVRTPPWWSGVCNVNNHPGSFPLSSWDGLTACAPGPNRGGYDASITFFPGAWGQYEWECVELSMRWLYLEYGVHPYPANGGQVVSNYSPADGGDLHAVANDGTAVPVPGDVISMGGSYEEGHTAVVTAVHVSHGYGTISVLEQNVDSGNGTNTIAVVGDVLQPEYSFTITGWLAVPPLAPRLPASLTADGSDLLLMAAGAPPRITLTTWQAAHATARPNRKLTHPAFWSPRPQSLLLEQVLGVDGTN
jgi:hypothetical protein